MFTENNNDSKDNERGRKKRNGQILYNKRESLTAVGGLGGKGIEQKKKRIHGHGKNKNNE